MNKQIPSLTKAELLKKMGRRKGANSFFAMYSSLWAGITTDPELMLIPLDDHMVHRGDGVFEAIKVVDGRIYLLDQHLERFQQSADYIGLRIPVSDSALRTIIHETVHQAGIVKNDRSINALVRLFLSRGPGNFTANPYDTEGPQIYCVVTQIAGPTPAKIAEGVHIGRSQIGLKAGVLAQAKTCNYLPNVLMKKESVDRKLDFTISFNDDGELAESATENIFIIDQQGRLAHPMLERILKGTTMMRIFELCKIKSYLPVVGEARIAEGDLFTAQGVFIAGTTLDVLKVTTYEGQRLKDSSRHAQEFLTWLKGDQLNLK